MIAIVTIPAFSQMPGTRPASRRPSVIVESAVSAAAAASPASVPVPIHPHASSATASSAYASRAPRIAQPSASAAPGGTSTSATQVSPSATWGMSAIAPTTTAIDNGRMSAQARPLRRSSHGGIPAAGSATSDAWAPISTPSATRNGVFTPQP